MKQALAFIRNDQECNISVYHNYDIFDQDFTLKKTIFQ